MKIRSKTLLILSVAWVAISLVVYIGFKSSIIHNYLALEEEETAEDLSRVTESINRMLSALEGSANDWAHWDDSYKFMINKNQTFIDSNIVSTSFESTGTDFILYFDTQGQYYYGGAYDHSISAMIPVSNKLLDFLLQQKSLLNPNDTLETKHTGVVRIDNQFVLISSAPITTSKLTGPIRGRIIMGYYLDDSHLKILSQTVKIPISIYPLAAEKIDPLLQQANQQLQSGKKYFVVPKNKDIIYGINYLLDIYKKPIGLIQIENDRWIYGQGISSLNRYLIVIIFLGIITLFVVWYALKVFLINRLLKANQEITEISNSSEFSKRLTISGNDQITSICLAINNMLGIIEMTQEQLKHRLSQSSDELEKLSKFNKNLASEVDRHISMESELKNQEQELRRLVYHDVLTELPNRIFFYEYLTKVISNAKQHHASFALLFLDVDGFKKINDTYGHDAGDIFLKHIAHQLTQYITDEDLAARLAGDEFLVYISSTARLTHIVERLLQAISQPVISNRDIIKATISIGISIYPQDALTLGDLQNHADLAMYSAKKKGGDCYFYYSWLRSEQISP